MLSLIAVFSTAAFALLVTSALRMARAGGGDPSEEARSVTPALYGALVAVLALGLFVTLT